MEREVVVRDIFKSISTKYDFIDSLMSFGLDKRWRRTVIDLLEIEEGMRIEDIGAGSGKATEEMLRRIPNLNIDAVDLTKEMFPDPIRNVNFTVASAEELPFENETFDRCVSCFLTRNLQALQKYIDESYRTLKTGGIFCNMDIFDPGKNFIAPAFRIYFYKFIPPIMNRVSPLACTGFCYNFLNSLPARIIRLGQRSVYLVGSCCSGTLILEEYFPFKIQQPLHINGPDEWCGAPNLQILLNNFIWYILISAGCEFLPQDFLWKYFIQKIY